MILTMVTSRPRLLILNRYLLPYIRTPAIHGTRPTRSLARMMALPVSTLPHCLSAPPAILLHCAPPGLQIHANPQMCMLQLGGRINIA